MISQYKKRALSVAITLAICGSAYAKNNETQTTEIAAKKTDSNQQETDNKQNVEKITVTGSRLRRDSFSVATPLVSMDRDAIADTGLGSLAEILVDSVPGINEGASNSNSQSSVQNTGLSTINLRNLGTTRTLTLIDGRRVVSNSYSGNYVSLSTIPASMVERVEIISGGASATYGSDAVAGVVNIITQQDKEGFEFDAKFGESTDGGGKEISLDLGFGQTFAQERGYFYFSASHEKQDGLSYYDRKRAQQEAVFKYNADLMCNQMQTEYDPDTDSKFKCMRDMTPADWRDRSDGTLGGVFGESSKNDTQFWYDESGLRSDWKNNEEKYGINTDQYKALKVPDKGTTAAIKINYELNDDLSSYFQVQYSKNNSFNVKSPEDEYEGAKALTLDPETGLADSVKPGYISIDNPYVPQVIIDSGLYKNRIYWDRRFAEVGHVTTDNERTTIRTWAGLQGVVFDGDWDWDLSVGYGQFKQRQIRYNELNTHRVKQALNAEYAADGVTIQCADADARANGCAPLNLFGIGSISTEAADYIRSNPEIHTDIRQYNILGYITGDLFDMPAGAASAVFGAEYRKDSQKLNTSKEQEFGGITFNVVPSFEGSSEVYEVFAELALPLLHAAPAAENLSAEFSLRIADYQLGNVGMVASYKAGLIWEPSAGYVVRANYARAQRAPTITELLSPARGDYDSFSDICVDTTATSTDPGHDNCRLEPTIAAVIATDGIFEGDDNNYSPNAGNINLTEETGDTYTFGITLAPASIEGLNIAIDYYDIRIKDAIESIDNADILAGCYNSPVGNAWGKDNEHCQNISRNEDGEIIEILQRVYNLDQLKTRGYDIAAQYDVDLTDGGSLRFKADYTHVLEHSKTTKENGIKLTNHYAGLLSHGIFKDKASVSLTWRKDQWRVRWSTKFKGSVIRDQDELEAYTEAVAANTAHCNDPAEQDKCISNPEGLAFNNISSFIKHDLSASYRFELASDTQLRVYGGLNNLFNNQGDFIVDGTGNFDSAYGGGLGRFAYLGAEVKF